MFPAESSQPAILTPPGEIPSQYRPSVNIWLLNALLISSKIWARDHESGKNVEAFGLGIHLPRSESYISTFASYTPRTFGDLVVYLIRARPWWPIDPLWWNPTALPFWLISPWKICLTFMDFHFVWGGASYSWVNCFSKLSKPSLNVTGYFSAPVNLL